MIRWLCAILIGWVLFCSKPATAIDPYAGMDPYWVILHEPVVQKEIGLSPQQKAEYMKLLDDLDLRCFPLRNQNYQVASEGLVKLTAEARQGLAKILDQKQQTRIDSIVFRKAGAPALFRDELRSRMAFTADQETKIRETIETTAKKVNELEKKLQSGGDKEALNKEFRDVKTKEQLALLELLTPKQRSLWRDAIGAPFDITKLGNPAMKAPELIDTGSWINSKPQSLADLRGQVVVVHFYAFQCGNCHANFPWYKNWHQDFADKGVTIIGIHTPETDSERSDANVRSSAKEAGFRFPVLVDGKNANWDAWGNSMWPSVYLIDKQGYVRQFWPGELNWQGQKGEEFMRGQIDKLLAEETP